MVTHYFTIFPNNQISPIRIVSANPLSGRCHAQRRIQQEYFHLMRIKCVHVRTREVQRIPFSYYRYGILDGGNRIWHTIQQQTICYKLGHATIQKQQVILKSRIVNLIIHKRAPLVKYCFHARQMPFDIIDFPYLPICQLRTDYLISNIGCLSCIQQCRGTAQLRLDAKPSKGVMLVLKS